MVVLLLLALAATALRLAEARWLRRRACAGAFLVGRSNQRASFHRRRIKGLNHETDARTGLDPDTGPEPCGKRNASAESRVMMKVYAWNRRGDQLDSALSRYEGVPMRRCLLVITAAIAALLAASGCITLFNDTAPAEGGQIYIVGQRATTPAIWRCPPKAGPVRCTRLQVNK
jgi:hypothetical protein